MPVDYCTVPMGATDAPTSSTSSKLVGLLVGAAVGVSVMLVATNTTNLHLSPSTTVSARPQPVVPPLRPRAGSAVMHAEAAQAPLATNRYTMASSQGAGPSFVQAAAPSSWNGSTGFLAGCVVTGLAFLAQQFQRRMPAATARHIEAALADESQFAMCGIAAHQNVDEAPDVLSREGEDVFSMRRKFEALCRDAQEKICAAIEEEDGEGKFQADAWVREDGGGGISRVMSGGKVFEKAGVNLSVVYGTMPQEALAAATARGAEYTKELKPGERVPFFACGLSSVMHPRNPHCPTMHFNYRYFETEGGAWWFGGGTDITPAYLDEDDMKTFHGTYKEVCDKHDPAFYAKYKKWADDYFVIKHRNETRGLGGIFFDDLNDRAPETIIKFSADCLGAVTKAYIPIINKNKDKEFTEKQKEWQLMRRGRYVEFNLVYDRGTIFGLKTGGRIESILMSLPETARWEYDHKVEPGSEEEKITKAFQTPRDWVSID